MLNIKEGSVIASKYKVIKKIGSGGRSSTAFLHIVHTS